jgi:hypothetical protein
MNNLKDISAILNIFFEGVRKEPEDFPIITEY